MLFFPTLKLPKYIFLENALLGMPHCFDFLKSDSSKAGEQILRIERGRVDILGHLLGTNQNPSATLPPHGLSELHMNFQFATRMRFSWVYVTLVEERLFLHLPDKPDMEEIQENSWGPKKRNPPIISWVGFCILNHQVFALPVVSKMVMIVSL